MRRLRMLMMVAALAVASVAILPATAQAARGSKFCDTANELLDDADGVLADPGDFDFTEEQIDEAIDAYKKLEKQAPKKLRKPYRTVRKYYEKFDDGDFDVTDPEDIEDLVTGGARVGRAFAKIYSYLVDECGIDVPDVTVPDVSIPEVPGRDGN
jgi:hypothetical protein